MSKIDITGDDLKELIAKNEKPILVDFWAPWCGPCRAMGPTVEKLAEERTDVTVVKLNGDEHPATAGKYGIQSIPALVLIINDTVVGTEVGMKSRVQLDEFLDHHLAQGTAV